jgi:chemotaxis protein methyltransferase CheR
MPDPVQDLMVLAKRLAGIDLGEHKRPLVEARLGKRLRALNLDLDAYAKLVQRDGAEQVLFIDCLTTNHTAWLREAGHFDDLSRRVLPALAAARGRLQRPSLRIWCAAASTGEEPYGIAMTLARTLGDLDRWDAAVLATDISTRALAKARAGVYDEERVSAVTDADRRIALEPCPKAGPGHWRVTDRLRALVHFARLNLMEDWPIRGPFDVIFCRNVMIYFDRETQSRLVNRLAGLLAPGGTLYVGHSESLSAIQHPLRTAGPATYVR